MRAGVIRFPGSNCDRDLAVAFGRAGSTVTMIWHKDTFLPAGLDIVAIPGGFSFGDYLRCGAIAARSPVMASVRAFADKGGLVIGICNGFQVLCEAGLLPGVLMRNARIKYICKEVELRVETTASLFTSRYTRGQVIRIPIAHHEGNYQADAETLAALRAEDRIAFTYRDTPNGAAADIAGILSENRRGLGMMPHPERLNDAALGGSDGARIFESIADSLATA
ncbi:MAG: phosphoribosylformylglycinamidine synthase subunit PurQ [Rhodobacteraceae bacterium]|nr:phosphoribosylformylglycinamidine synthase subunit PurQ [Paracoccaceae bacterium]